MARPPETTAALRRVRAALTQRGLLLQAGNEFASVAEITAGERISGSWWAHPKSNLIYWVCQGLDDDARVVETRLLAGKVTHVWKTLHDALVAVATARTAWQIDGLSAAAQRLLDAVDSAPVRTDALAWSSKSEKLGDACRALERRLLVRTEEVHTATGRHAKQLSTWSSWWAARGDAALPEVDEGRARIERAVGDALALLPWHAKPRRKTRASKHAV